MILYESDWLRYPQAIIHYSTKNTTWLRQAEVYRRMGIKNNAFLLALIQPELEHVNPHDPNLSQEMKVRVGLECKYNPWYFLREVVRVPAQGGPVPNKLKANRGNIALYWLYLNSIDCGLIQPRQTGKSVSTDCLMIYLIYIGAQNSRINLFTKDDPLRKANVDRLKGIRDHLPKHLVNITPRDSDNVFELTCKLLGNSYTTGVAQNSESAANNSGRGLTSPTQHFDEGPFCNFIDETIRASLPGGTSARAEAAAHNLPNGNIFTTTAGKKDSRSGKFMYEMFHEAAVWTEKFLDAQNNIELRDMVKRNASGKKVMVNITMSHRQLGYTDEWLYVTMAENKSEGEHADRDFFNVWTSGSMRSPLSVTLNEAIRASLRDVAYTDISPEHYIIRWYHTHEEHEEYMANGRFVIGLDTSEAVGRDAIAMVLTDVYDLSTVGTGTYNETMLPRFANYLFAFMMKYPNTTLVIEKKSTGQMIVDHLIMLFIAAGVDPFVRIFNRIVDMHIEKKDDYQEILKPMQYRSDAFYDKRKNQFGFNTDASKRDLLYTTVLQNAAKNAHAKIYDKTLIEEINGLVEKNGRIDHNSSGHDDHVISWLLTHWFLFHSRNLKHYGIDPMLVMACQTVDGKELTEDQIQERLYQEKLIKEADAIINELKKVDNEFMQAKLEAKLRTITSRLTSMSVETTALDALLKNATEERNQRNRLNPAKHRGLSRPINWQSVMSSSSRY